MAVARAHPALHEDRATESGTSSCAMDSKHGTGDPACECSSCAQSDDLIADPAGYPSASAATPHLTPGNNRKCSSSRTAGSPSCCRPVRAITPCDSRGIASCRCRSFGAHPRGISAASPSCSVSRGRRLHAGFLAVQCGPPPGAVQPAGDRLPIGAPLRVV
jgi:hypothetical protein